METGLECYDANGNKMFDTDDIAWAIIGTGYTGDNDGYIADANITSDTQILLYDATYTDTGVTLGVQFARPFFKIENGKISWSYNQQMRSQSRYILGYRFLYGGSLTQ